MRCSSESFRKLHLQALALLEKCELCPRKCGVNRLRGETGFCKTPDEGFVWRELVNCYEESSLNPSHQIYFAGCNLRCAYCSVMEENLKLPRPLAQEDVLRAIEQSCAKTLNLLGGEPAVNIAAALRLLSKINFDGQIVWNSNMYYSEAVSRLVAQFTDIYLADFKCFDELCCRDVLGAANYRSTAQARLLEAADSGQTVIVRHLLLPGHIECCLRPIAEWVANNLPTAFFSLRDNFCPFPERANCPVEYPSKEERYRAKEIANLFSLKIMH